MCWLDASGNAACTCGSCPATTGPFTQISCGSGHYCTLDALGRLQCHGSTVGATPSGTFSKVHCGAATDVAIDSAGNLHFWGE